MKALLSFLSIKFWKPGVLSSFRVEMGSSSCCAAARRLTERRGLNALVERRVHAVVSRKEAHDTTNHRLGFQVAKATVISFFKDIKLF